MTERKIAIWDERFGEPRLVATHNRVPKDLTHKEIFKRYGIGEHLAVYEHIGGWRQCIQFGSRGGYRKLIKEQLEPSCDR